MRLNLPLDFYDELRDHGPTLHPFSENDMSTAIAWLLPRASATSVAKIEGLVTVALFGGVGLLLSLSVLILDQNIPGEWF
jgi:hypothetical protein